MNKKIRLCLILTALIFPLSSVWPLTMDEVLADVENTYEVIAAKAAIESIRRQITELAFPGDMTFSFQPDADVITPTEGPFADVVDLSGSISISVPLGLSDMKEQALASANNSLSLAQINLQTVGDAMLLKLYVLYQDAWLAQEEQAVLQLELDAARTTYDVKRLLFESGKIALVELAQVEDELRRREADLLKGRLEYRLTSLELSLARGLLKIKGETPDNADETEALQAYLESGGELPRPGKLEAWVGENHPDVIQQLKKIWQVESSIAELAGMDFTATVRTNVSAYSHTGSVSYNIDSSTLAGSYSFPIYTFGDDKLSNQSSWTVGLSVNLGFTTAKSADLEVASLKLSLEMELARLSSIKETLYFQLRSKYQQYLVAVEASDQSIRNLDRSTADFSLVQDRWEKGQITENELLEAEARYERARQSAVAAQIGVYKAEMAAAVNAAYLSEYFTEGE
ncbi:MAG: TolC family protein [Spirochaetales bacterium]|jgi:outer membrane protein TolC|nr:TolC family protein [Spirochaetales bacterium]